MVSCLKRISVSFLVAFAILAFSLPEVHGQRHALRGRPALSPQQFHPNPTGSNRSRSFFGPRPFGFDPFLRERIRFDPFLRQQLRFDPLLQREFVFDALARRCFLFDPFLGSGVFGFPAPAVTPFFFRSVNGF